MDQHRFSRMQLLVGSAGIDRLASASVAVFGIGGVGSYAAEALARAGVGRLTLVDFDDICLTNVNRQIHALDGTIGRPKVLVMAERCRAINPAALVEPIQSFYEAKNAEELLGRGYDYVLDCIDHITAKLHLIQSCRERGLPIIASMGAANKLDPKKIAVADLFDTQKCRLARIIRKELRKRGIVSGVPVVYSTEEFRPLSGETAVCAANCICPSREDQRWSCGDRRVILGSSSYIPPLFGLTMAGEVIRTLLGEGTPLMDSFPLQVLALIAVGFVSGFLNILAGGGSLLTLPLLIFLGLPATVANATNRVGVLFQNVFAVDAFRRRGIFPARLALFCSLPAIVGSFLGARLAVDIDEVLFQRLLAVIMIGILVFTLVDPMKNRRREELVITPGRAAVLLLSFFAIGVYGGFIQAGVGFLIIPALMLHGVDLVRTNAVKIIVVLIFTIPALAVFLWHDQVNWPLGIALAVGNSAGGWVATHVAVKKGHDWIKRVVSLTVLVFALKLLFAP